MLEVFPCCDFIVYFLLLLLLIQASVRIIISPKWFVLKVFSFFKQQHSAQVLTSDNNDPRKRNISRFSRLMMLSPLLESWASFSMGLTYIALQISFWASVIASCVKFVRNWVIAKGETVFFSNHFSIPSAAMVRSSHKLEKSLQKRRDFHFQRVFMPTSYEISSETSWILEQVHRSWFSLRISFPRKLSYIKSRYFFSTSSRSTQIYLTLA